MLKYTRAAIYDTVEDFKKIFTFISVSSHIFYIAYLIYSLVAERGNAFVNAALLVTSLFVLALSLVIKKRELMKIARRGASWAKLVINVYSIGISVYAIFYTANGISAASLVICALMVIFTVLKILLEIVIFVVEAKTDFILAGIRRDFEYVIKTANAVGNVVKTIGGYERVEYEELPESVRAELDAAAERHGELLRVRRAERKRTRWIKKEKKESREDARERAAK